MKYQKGDRVRHPTQEWGFGEVLEDSTADAVRIFFVGAGEKILSLAHVEPIKLAPENAAHPVLDNLRKTKASSGIRYQSLPDSIACFLEKFPKGFYGERFATQERDYKLQANEQAKKLLNEAEIRSLIECGNYPEVVRRALKIMNATNLVFPNEKMALKDGLLGETAQKKFTTGLVNLLYGEASVEDRLMGLAGTLEELGAAKWTTLTYFPFIVKPAEFMFVKPTITQHAAELCGFEINYRPQLNWLTYKQVLSLSNYLKTELAELNPRDMIDVQSFMWCIAPRKYQITGD